MGKCVSQHFLDTHFHYGNFYFWIVAKVSILPTECDLEYMIDLAQKRLLADVYCQHCG